MSQLSMQSFNKLYLAILHARDDAPRYQAAHQPPCLHRRAVHYLN
jgi:hypothetical protein